MKNKKKLTIILIALALVLLGVLWFWYSNYYRKSSTPAAQQNSPSTAEQQQEADANAAQKKQAIENPPTTQSSTKPVAASNITLSAQKETNGTVTVFTRLIGVSAGTCTLSVSSNGKSSTQTADVIYQPQYSSCAGFSVPISSVGKGMWTIKLTLTTQGNSTSNEITQEIN